MKQIKSKEEFYKKWNAGAFGNKPRTWDRLIDAVYCRDYAGTVSLRYKGAGGGGFCAYNVPIGKVLDVASEWIDKGADRELITINESAPDDELIAQGEVMQSPEGLVIRVSTEKTKMRDAMKTAVHYRGLHAVAYLKAIMTPSSYEDLMAIFDSYPDSVVEFGAYTRPVGDVRGRNTLIWETRDF